MCSWGSGASTPAPCKRLITLNSLDWQSGASSKVGDQAWNALPSAGLRHGVQREAKHPVEGEGGKRRVTLVLM